MVRSCRTTPMAPQLGQSKLGMGVSRYRFYPKLNNRGTTNFKLRNRLKSRPRFSRHGNGNTIRPNVGANGSAIPGCKRIAVSRQFSRLRGDNVCRHPHPH